MVSGPQTQLRQRWTLTVLPLPLSEQFALKAARSGYLHHKPKDWQEHLRWHVEQSSGDLISVLCAAQHPSSAFSQNDSLPLTSSLSFLTRCKEKAFSPSQHKGQLPFFSVQASEMGNDVLKTVGDKWLKATIQHRIRNAEEHPTLSQTLLLRWFNGKQDFAM